MPAAVTADWRYRILVGGYSVSSYGTFLNMVALNLFVYATTDSALAMGLFMAVRLGAGFLTGLTAGSLLARVAVKPVMLWMNLAQAAAMLVLAFVPDGLRTVALFVASATIGACSTVFMVALRSSIPDLVGEERRSWANSLMVGGRSMAMVAGFASAGVVVSQLGFTAAFLLDAASFLVCAATVIWLPDKAGRTAEGDRTADGAGTAEKAEAGADSGRKLSVAVTALAAVPAMGLMVILRGVDALGSSSHNAALPVYSSALDPGDPAAFVSRFWLFWALGNVLAQQVIQRWVKHTGRSVGAVGFGLGTVAMSSAFILGFAGFPIAATLVIALVAGAADGLTEVSYTSHLQTLPETLRGHAFGISATVENLGFGVGMIAVAAALEAFSPFSVVAWSHGVAIVVALVFLIRLMGGRGRWGRSDKRSSVEGGNADAGDPHSGRRDGAEVSGG
ncbi:MFS transporter [Streptomyces sp. ISL-98]|uniref:MFS transporter n=1 Tax=Streptomyces sp. ISL-98 TaxID=2819192 RepID=UPI001BE7100F|nr:MFS transporter [Streptomyces sp. ISL-98]MBT2507871.1 MFS transporter [Streptomyces sp. ISL-98]